MIPTKAKPKQAPGPVFKEGDKVYARWDWEAEGEESEWLRAMVCDVNGDGTYDLIRSVTHASDGTVETFSREGVPARFLQLRAARRDN